MRVPQQILLITLVFTGYPVSASVGINMYVLDGRVEAASSSPDAPVTISLDICSSGSPPFESQTIEIDGFSISVVFSEASAQFAVGGCWPYSQNTPPLPPGLYEVRVVGVPSLLFPSPSTEETLLARTFVSVGARPVPASGSLALVLLSLVVACAGGVVAMKVATSGGELRHARW